MKASRIMVGIFIQVVLAASAAYAQKQIAISDLAGVWGFGNSQILTYLERGTGDLSHAGNVYGMKYTIKSDGTFVYKFAAHYGIKTNIEDGGGSVVVSRDVITFKFDQGPAEQYKFVALETDPKRGLVLTLVQLNDSAGRTKCGHSTAYFDCTGRQEWERRR